MTLDGKIFSKIINSSFLLIRSVKIFGCMHIHNLVSFHKTFIKVFHCHIVVVSSHIHTKINPVPTNDIGVRGGTLKDGIRQKSFA